MKKEKLRKDFLEKRKKLGESQISLDDQIVKRFFTSFSFIGKQLIHIYIPIQKFNEVNTNLLIEEFKRRNQRITVPVITRDNLISREINQDTNWRENNWNITEPVNGVEIDPLMIDVVIVPLLAYDTKGFRVGYGKGYYDKFLKQCRNDILKIGLSYFPPVEMIDDIDLNDVPLSFCVTPEKLYEF